MFRILAKMIFGIILTAFIPAINLSAAPTPLPTLPSFAIGTNQLNPPLVVDVTDLPAGVSAANCVQPILNAAGNGSDDDQCALQAALNYVAANNGGIVFLPTGSYLVKRTLLIGNDTWIIGEDKANTIVLRGGEDPDDIDYYRKNSCGVSGGVPSSVGTLPSFILFANKYYNCGNENIVLANFTVDGTNAPGPCGYPKLPCTNSIATAVTIAFSAVEDTHIWNLNIKNAPQDAIFLRNGGNRTSVTNTIIDGFNMNWYNGAAINVEMWDDGYIGNYHDPVDYPPVTLMGNTIISRSDQVKPKAGPQIGGIGINRPNFTPPYTLVLGMPPKALIQNNTIEVHNNHTAIGCLDCIDSVLAANIIRSTNPNTLETLNHGVPAFAPGSSDPLFSGIVASGENIQILDNEILGSGVQNDGLAILVQPSDRTDIGNRGVRVVGNVIRDKNLKVGAAALRVREVQDATVMNNILENISHQDAGRGIFIGSYCTAPVTRDVLVAGNRVSMSNNTQGYSIWKTFSSMFLNNLDNGSPLMLVIDNCHDSPYIFP